MAGNSAPKPSPQAGVSPGSTGSTLASIQAAIESGSIPGLMGNTDEPRVLLGTKKVSGSANWDSPHGQVSDSRRAPEYEAAETLTASEWARRWYQLSAEERADYTERFAQAGMSVSSPMQARSAWIALGELAAEQYGNGTGDNITPDDLLDTLIAEAPVSDEEDLSPVEERDLRAKARTQLERFAYDNGLTLNNDTLKRHVDGIVKEETTLASIQKAYMRQLTAAYPAFSEQIEAGFTLREIAAPYAQEMSRLLEIPEDAIDYRDPAMAKALQAVGNDGKPTYVPLWQFREELKKDDRWQYTDNAWNEMGDKAMSIARMFGLTA